MRNDVLFINVIIVITLLYSLIQGIQLIFMGSRVEEVDAKIIKTRYANKNGTKANSTKTGDSTNVMPFVALGVVALAGIGFCVVRRKKSM